MPTVKGVNELENLIKESLLKVLPVRAKEIRVAKDNQEDVDYFGQLFISISIPNEFPFDEDLNEQISDTLENEFSIQLGDCKPDIYSGDPQNHMTLLIPNYIRDYLNTGEW